jgi:hypothetical protein
MVQKRDGEGSQSVWERRWRERIGAWRGSGQTQREFCQAHGISMSSFSHWKAELVRRDQLRAPAGAGKNAASAGSCERSSESLKWSEVHWSATGAAAAVAVQDGSGFEIVLPRGWSVRLGPRFEAEPLRRLLSVLEERSC